MKEKSEAREKVLEDEVELTEKFDEQHKPFNSWLDTIEPKIKDLRPLPCEEDSLNRQVKQAKEVVEDIKQHKPVLEDMEKTAKEAVSYTHLTLPTIYSV